MTKLEALYLGGNQFIGTLPVSIGRLASLSVLNTENNFFSDYIPAALGQCSNLTELYLGVNYFSGSLPPELGNLSKLTIFDASSNGISGTLPPEWGKGMSNITYLVLSNNAIEGTLPPEWSLLGKTLRVLHMSLNFLTGCLPESWGPSWIAAEQIWLNDNALEGTLPSSWSGMAMITSVYVLNNELSGTLPSSWGMLTRLRALYLSYNYISGTFPPQWSTLKSLFHVEIGACGISGTLPSEWRSMTSLQAALFGHNMLTGTLPAEWSELPAMQMLSLRNNFLEGEVPATWSNMTSLQYVNLGSNKLSGDFPNSWFSIPSITLIVANNNKALSGELNFSRVASNLSLVDFANCNFNMTAITSITCPPPCSFTLVLSACDIEGPLPPMPLTAPQKLILSHNKITGALPSVVNISMLDASFNAISSFSSCIVGNLSTLRLDNNAITSLPDHAAGCSMPSLTTFSVSNNPLASIPVRMDQLMPNLAVFAARNCSLNQVMPTFANYNLRVLDVAENKLSPLAVQFSPQPQWVDVSHTSDSVAYVLDVASLCPDGLKDCLYQTSASTAMNATCAFDVTFTCPCSMWFDVSVLVDNDRFMMNWLTHPSGEVLPFDGSSRDIYITYQASLSPNEQLPSYVVQPVPAWNFSVQTIPILPSAWFQFHVDDEFLLANVSYTITAMLGCGYGPCHQTSCQRYAQFSTYLVSRRSSCEATLVAVPFTTSCVACPQFGQCNGSLLITAINAWRPSRDLLPFVPCGASHGCLSGGFGDTCIEGYQGVLCSVCSTELNFGRSINECVTCYSRFVNYCLLALGCIGGLSLVTYIVFRSTSPRRNRTMLSLVRSNASMALKLYLNHLSLLAPLTNTAVFELLHQGSATTMHAQATPVMLPLLRFSTFSCLFPSISGIHEAAIIVALCPALILLQLFLQKLVLRSDLSLPSIVTCVVQLLYMPVVSHAIRLLRYETYSFYDTHAYLVGNASAVPVVTIETLASDRNVMRDGSTDLVKSLAWAVLFVFGIVAPAGFCLVYRVIGRAKSEMAFGFLTRNFSQSAWYWEAVICCRKILTAACVATLFSIPEVQFQLFMTVIVGYMGFHEYFSPHRSRQLAAAERISCISSYLTANLLLLCYSWSPDVLKSTALAVGIIVLQAVVLLALTYAIALEMRVQFEASEFAKSDDVDEMLLQQDARVRCSIHEELTYLPPRSGGVLSSS